jgi:hypothetical protein
MRKANARKRAQKSVVNKQKRKRIQKKKQQKKLKTTL